MDPIYQPLFLKNSPSLICEQILYLVKNSNLNFEVNETPYSLNLNLKKSFTNHWNKPKSRNNLSNQTQFPQHVIDDPAQQPQQPSVGQPPGHIPEHLFSFSQFSQHPHPKHHQHTVPQDRPHVDQHGHPVHQHSVDPPQNDPRSMSKPQEGTKLCNQIEIIKAEHDKRICCAG